MSPIWARLLPIVLIGAIPLALFRLHIIGATTFIGNSDRLNSFLNILKFYTQSLKEGQLAAWNDGMFTGINTFALPSTFPNPLVILEAAVSQQALFYIAGIVSCLLLSVAGWAAYSAIRAFGASRYAAFTGTALYQCSALSILKVSQNDMSFAVLIVIPLMMREIRRALGHDSARSFARLSIILSCLLWFMFLQKAAYALLLGGGYALTLAWREINWRPLAIFGGGVVVAIVSASPRIHALWRELTLVDRKTPGVDLNSFEQLYEFQNIRWYEVFRWLDNGVFGRFPAEAAALGNNINLTEGMLLYTTVFTALVVLFAVVRYQSQWFAIPLCRAGEASFCFYAFAVSTCAIVVKPIGAILYYLFLNLDFTHARIIVAGLFPLCALISFALDDRSPSGERAAEGWNFRPLALWAIAVLCALAILLGLVPRYKADSDRLFADSSFHALNQVGQVLTHQSVKLVPSLPGDSPHGQPLRILRIPAGSVMRIAIAAMCVSGMFLWLQLARRHHAARRMVPLLLGAAMVCDALLSADFQLNGKHVRTDAVPFMGGNIFQARGDEFVPPSAEALTSFKRKLETDQYRSVTVCDPRLFPAGCAAHLSTFWGLRLVDGYSIGVPRVLGVLPWPPGVHHLRDLTFPTAHALPWNVLSLLNVKYAVVVSEAFYKNRVRAGVETREAMAIDIETLENPLPVVPRAFFVQRVEPVSGAAEGVGRLFDGRTSVDPEQTSFVEGLEAPREFLARGEPRVSFKGDHVEIELESSAEPRFLVLNERPHPSWHAYAQGDELPVYSTNVVMRGILVPAGVTHVSLRFDPFGLSRVWVLFPIGSVVLAFLGLLGLSRTAKQDGKLLAVPRPE